MKENLFEKVELKNGESFYLIEKTNLKTNIVKTTSSSFKIKRIPDVLGSASIILTKDFEYIGHISSIIYKDKTAALYMNEIRNVNFPNELSYVNLEDKALVVDEKYRGQGKSKELIYLMLSYLASKGITQLYVNGITDEIAMKTYLGTGASQLTDTTAVYSELHIILQSAVFDQLFGEYPKR